MEVSRPSSMQTWGCAQINPNLLVAKKTLQTENVKEVVTKSI